MVVSSQSTAVSCKWSGGVQPAAVAPLLYEEGSWSVSASSKASPSLAQDTCLALFLDSVSRPPVALKLCSTASAVELLQGNTDLCS